jgi:hypothetical protein
VKENLMSKEFLSSSGTKAHGNLIFKDVGLSDAEYGAFVSMLSLPSASLELEPDCSFWASTWGNSPLRAIVAYN